MATDEPLGNGPAALPLGAGGSANHPLDDRDTAHLLRRAGFGADDEDMRVFPGKTRGEAVDLLLSARPMVLIGPSNLERKLEDIRELQRWWLRRMLSARHRLREKLVLFWHDHFPSQWSSGGPLNEQAFQNGTFRVHGLGSFRNLLHEVTRDPAMLRFLDGRDNRAGNPNENYAREVMELFTLGPVDVNGEPNYTQRDVEELARALTGFRSLRTVNNESALLPHLFDDGHKVLFEGRSFEASGQLGVEFENGLAYSGFRNVLNALFNHRDSDGRPTLARFLSRKLWEWLAYPEPDLDLVDELADVFVAGDYQIQDLVYAILTHDEFYSDRARRLSVKTPIDVALQATRVLGIEVDLDTLRWFVTRMGMTLFDPPGVDGWAHGESWLSPSLFLERVRFAEVFASKISDDAHLVDRRLWLPGDIVDALLARLDLDVSDDVRDALIHSLEGTRLSPGESTLPATRNIVALLLALPEFQVH